MPSICLSWGRNYLLVLGAADTFILTVWSLGWLAGQLIVELANCILVTSAFFAHVIYPS